jgi:hypothetical protein
MKKKKKDPVLCTVPYTPKIPALEEPGVRVGLELGYGFNSLGGYVYFIITSSSGGLFFVFFL